MTAPKPSASGLLPGNVGPEPGAPPPIARARYFVAVNGVLMDGAHTLAVLTPYFYTVPAAERAQTELRAEFPKCEILWTYSTYDPTDSAQLAELQEIDGAAATERGEEGVQ